MSAKDDAIDRAERDIFSGLQEAGLSNINAFAYATACKPILEGLWNEAVEWAKENYVPALGTRE